MAKRSAALVVITQASKRLRGGRQRASGHRAMSLAAQGRMELGAGAYINISKGLIPDSTAVFQQLQETVPWLHQEIAVMGRHVLQPRLIAYMADNPNLVYTYSGATLKPILWTETVLQIKSLVEKFAGLSFNSCLLNFYRTGADHLSWHSDNESLYGPAPIIGSASLGSARDFLIRHNIERTEQHSIRLESGDVLVMGGSMQQHWMHSIPKRARVDARINLTFRNIITA